jgi:exosortase H (IPTLxxWG-CTERM-specific)
MPRGLAVRFIVLFVVLLAAGNLLFMVPSVESGFIEPWTQLNATGSAALASALGVETRVSGTIVDVGTASLNIMQGCNGVHALLVLLSAILAFPAPWSRRLLGVAAGTVALLGFNLLRLVNLIVVARHFPAQLELFHVAIWQTLIVLIALALFLTWGVFLATGGSPRRGVDPA